MENQRYQDNQNDFEEKTKVGELITLDFKYYYVIMKKRRLAQKSTNYTILFILNSRKTNQEGSKK